MPNFASPTKQDPIAHIFTHDLDLQAPSEVNVTENSIQVIMRPFLQSGFSAKRQPQHGVYDDEDEDGDGQYESTDDSIGSSAGSYAESHSSSPSRTRPQAAGDSYLGNMRGQAPPPQSTSSGEPAAHALQQPVPQWSTLDPAQRYRNPNLASPVGFNLPRRPVPSPASTAKSDPGNSASPAGPNGMNHRVAAETGFSIRRKPLIQPAGKRVLIAVFGMTGTGKTSSSYQESCWRGSDPTSART